MMHGFCSCSNQKQGTTGPEVMESETTLRDITEDTVTSLVGSRRDRLLRIDLQMVDEDGGT